MTSQSNVRVFDVSACGGEIVTLRCERPEGYAFGAGQWSRVTLDTDAGAETRTLSIASAPGDEWLEFATRLSASAFKLRLGQLTHGDSVGISPPGGRFRLREEDVTPVFLAGGVGITPVRSMLRDAEQTGRTFENAVLLYGNRDDTCELYLEELAGYETAGLRLVRVLERAPDGWDGETGFITAEMVARLVPDAATRPFYVSGPPVMVTVMSSVMDEVGVAADSRRIESFGKAGE